MRSTRLAKNMK
ncbi:hypothetical protein E2C01_098315 [Portunus trituberculatus]|uniref:Uncharacterized protein n=1 Tax=Portunus trituberculatus TaxID=210409 RepID=A0A5B7K834_PORTR|nr:hypothetical protein [Portunus trituberculatus]